MLGPLVSGATKVWRHPRILERYGGGGGGGFFLACEDFGRMFDNLFPAFAFFHWRLAPAH